MTIGTCKVETIDFETISLNSFIFSRFSVNYHHLKFKNYISQDNVFLKKVFSSLDLTGYILIILTFPPSKIGSLLLAEILWTLAPTYYF